MRSLGRRIAGGASGDLQYLDRDQFQDSRSVARKNIAFGNINRREKRRWHGVAFAETRKHFGTQFMDINGARLFCVARRVDSLPKRAKSSGVVCGCSGHHCSQVGGNRNLWGCDGSTMRPRIDAN